MVPEHMPEMIRDSHFPTTKEDTLLPSKCSSDLRTKLTSDTRATWELHLLRRFREPYRCLALWMHVKGSRKSRQTYILFYTGMSGHARLRQRKDLEHEASVGLSHRR